jgi:hypothetical protein
MISYSSFVIEYDKGKYLHYPTPLLKIKYNVVSIILDLPFKTLTPFFSLTSNFVSSTPFYGFYWSTKPLTSP